MVLPWVRHLVLQHLDEAVERNSNDRTKSVHQLASEAGCVSMHGLEEMHLRRANPIDPVIRIELSSRNTRPKGACRVETAACEEHTDQLCNEQGKTDTDRSHVGRFMLLLGQHEDCEDQLRGQDHLDEHASCDAGVFRESRAHVKFVRKEDLNQEGGEDGPCELRTHEEEAAHVVDRLGHDHTEGHCRVCCGHPSQPRHRLLLLLCERHIDEDLLNSPPLTRKKIQTFTIRLKPKETAT